MRGLVIYPIQTSQVASNTIGRDSGCKALVFQELLGEFDG